MRRRMTFPIKQKQTEHHGGVWDTLITALTWALSALTDNFARQTLVTLVITRKFLRLKLVRHRTKATKRGIYCCQCVIKIIAVLLPKKNPLQHV